MLQVPAVVVSRFGPWFGRVVKSNPRMLDTVGNKLRAGGAAVGSKLSDIVGFFKSSPVNAALTLATVASVGVGVSELFDGVEADADWTGLLDGLENVAAYASPAQREAAAKKIMAAGALSESFGAVSEQEEIERASSIEVLRWAKGHFGGNNSVLTAHRLLQAFLEMPYERVRTDLATLRI